MVVKRKVFVTDDNNLKKTIISLENDSHRSQRIIRILNDLGNFKNEIKLFVKRNYKKGGKLYTIDNDNTLFSFWDSSVRDVRRKNILSVEKDNIIKSYNLLAPTNEELEEMGHRINDYSILFVNNKKNNMILNLELNDNTCFTFDAFINSIQCNNINILINQLRQTPNIDFFTFYTLLKQVFNFNDIKTAYITSTNNNSIISRIDIKNGNLVSFWIIDNAIKEKLTINYENNKLDIECNSQNIDNNKELKEIISKSKELIKKK